MTREGLRAAERRLIKQRIRESQERSAWQDECEVCGKRGCKSAHMGRFTSIMKR